MSASFGTTLSPITGSASSVRLNGAEPPYNLPTAAVPGTSDVVSTVASGFDDYMPELAFQEEECEKLPLHTFYNRRVSAESRLNVGGAESPQTFVSSSATTSTWSEVHDYGENYLNENAQEPCVTSGGAESPQDGARDSRAKQTGIGECQC